MTIETFEISTSALVKALIPNRTCGSKVHRNKERGTIVAKNVKKTYKEQSAFEATRDGPPKHKKRSTGSGVGKDLTNYKLTKPTR